MEPDQDSNHTQESLFRTNYECLVNALKVQLSDSELSLAQARKQDVLNQEELVIDLKNGQKIQPQFQVNFYKMIKLAFENISCYGLKIAF